MAGMSSKRGLTTRQKQWLREIHLRPVVRYDGEIFIAIASDLIQNSGRSSIGFYIMGINHWTQYAKQERNQLRQRGFRAFTDAEIASEILMGSDIAKAREAAEIKYGRHK